MGIYGFEWEMPPLASGIWSLASHCWWCCLGKEDTWDKLWHQKPCTTCKSTLFCARGWGCEFSASCSGCFAWPLLPCLLQCPYFFGAISKWTLSSVSYIKAWNFYLSNRKATDTQAEDKFFQFWFFFLERVDLKMIIYRFFMCGFVA